MSKAITNTAANILHDVFGYKAFRPGQEDVVNLLASGRHVLVVMPTGAGKSLCFQIPALLQERLTVVVSPLMALMDDQVAALRANGIAAACIHSGIAREEQVINWRAAAAGKARLLYMSPERLMTPRMLDALKRLQPMLIVIDEAHCISKWGASFRPEYEQLSALCEYFPDAVIAAFTATADTATRHDIAQKLFRGNGDILLHGFDRPNLHLGVSVKTDWKTQLLDFLADKRDSAGIVYCLSRKYTDEVAEFLNRKGCNAIAYHAGQDAGVRKANQNRFMTEDNVTMVATIAFGMGIDKPDIRYVCHLNMPGSMEAYYQEIGRAGRDGLPAETMLLYDLRDMRMRRQFIDQEETDNGHKLREHKRLDALLAFCEAARCRRAALLSYFEESSEACGNCDNCANPPELIDANAEAQILFATVRDTGQMFGGAHIVDVVTGAKTQKLLSRSHDRLESYGAGSKQPKPYWQAFIRQAVAGNYLTINIQKFGALQLTAKGEHVLAGQDNFQLRKIGAKKVARPSRHRTTNALTLDENDQRLLLELKKTRFSLARARNVPAYVVFSDATLQDMAARRPTTLNDMAEINGVGPKKLRDFGAIFLSVVETDAG